MNDYTWPSVYFAYFFFALCLGVAIFFFVRSWKDGYWKKDGEEIKYRVFDDEPLEGLPAATGGTARFKE
jgi:hypothetical protein